MEVGMLQGAEVMGFECNFLTCTLSSFRSPDLFCPPEPVRRTQALNPQWVYLCPSLLGPLCCQRFCQLSRVIPSPGSFCMRTNGLQMDEQILQTSRSQNSPSVHEPLDLLTPCCAHIPLVSWKVAPGRNGSLGKSQQK